MLEDQGNESSIKPSVAGWFMLYFGIHVLSSYHIVHGIPSFSFHYNACRTPFHLHAEPHLFWVSRTTWLSMRTSVH